MSLKKLAAALLMVLGVHTAQAKEPVTLIVGEQNYYNIQASMEASGVLKDLPYKIEWKHFQAAAPIAESLNSGALDLGFLGDSGLLTLAARGAPVKVVATSRQNLDGVAIQVAGNAPIRTVQDLKGKTVAVWRGAWSQQLILRALERANLPPDYVKFSYLMPVDATTALSNGSVDAVSLWEPFVSTLQLHQGARTLVTAKGLMPALSFVAAYDKSAQDKHAEIEDFLKRLIVARRWVDSHLDEYAELWSKRANIDRDVAYRWLSTAHQAVGPIDDQAARDAQDTADFLFKQGVFPQRFETQKILDRSYATVFAK
ncbi:NitT/TauT family transport system substrate-binding protein [Herbaspirillum sp. Sphag1AN]|uniref:ABC transporter substrate-binding protein n=1 Tax=unclassified Herbaspirillum TaxID=2624150 RepID=UPI001607F3AC|nr:MULTISPECIES: ABC transporter substrate-binding protein [unclassified Herbaspirillum]MBB3211874.1 NitT/TauT family transport system substrate-binding protein [Herbaspirillum sp. Sphag1AN]MBB3244292.1 NitT/TauT family transport system substrate-binding protein [Herbaspirillum sp. Sphag64]